MADLPGPRSAPCPSLNPSRSAARRSRNQRRLVGAGLALPSFRLTGQLQGQGKPRPYETPLVAAPPRCTTPLPRRWYVFLAACAGEGCEIPGCRPLRFDRTPHAGHVPCGASRAESVRRGGLTVGGPQDAGRRECQRAGERPMRFRPKPDAPMPPPRRKKSAFAVARGAAGRKRTGRPPYPPLAQLLEKTQNREMNDIEAS